MNTYDVRFAADEDRALLFEHRESEGAGGTRARMRLRLLGEDEYEMVLDLAAPGKDFEACQQVPMRRVR